MAVASGGLAITPLRAGGVPRPNDPTPCLPLVGRGGAARLPRAHERTALMRLAMTVVSAYHRLKCCLMHSQIMGSSPRRTQKQTPARSNASTVTKWLLVLLASLT